MKEGKNSIFLGAILMGLAVAIGAIGAHALKQTLDARYLATFYTGAKYHTYHALGLLALGAIENSYGKKFTIVKYLIVAGIVLFSFNCYIYAITQIKIFAMIVPIGGFSFIFAWLTLAWKVIRE